MHTNIKPNTTANPNAEGDSAVQVKGRAKQNLMTPDEARTLASYLIEAANFADLKAEGEEK